ncbi:MAG TPA: hypothetical protein VIL36_11290, partial [Acidimicrobiales bacterium]
MSWHIIGEAMSLVTWWAIRDRILRRGPRRTLRTTTVTATATSPAAAATPPAEDPTPTPTNPTPVTEPTEA